MNMANGFRQARGYFEIGIYNPKTSENIGTLWRSAMQLGAAGIFTIGPRYRYQSTDTIKSHRHIPLRHYLGMDDFMRCIPEEAELVGIEMGGKPLSQFTHFTQTIYLLGAEDYGLPADVRKLCKRIVSLEAIGPASYNVAVAGSIVMYARQFSAK